LRPEAYKDIERAVDVVDRVGTDGEAVAFVQVWHSQRGAVDARQGGDVGELLEAAIALELVAQGGVAEDPGGDPHAPAAILGQLVDEGRDLLQPTEGRRDGRPARRGSGGGRRGGHPLVPEVFGSGARGELLVVEVSFEPGAGQIRHLLEDLLDRHRDGEHQLCP
jgi:hypothetical protein